MKRKIKLALLNIMPNAIEYESMIRAALANVADDIELYPIRLATHQYNSSGDSISGYRTFDQITHEVALDLLIITGAPVEHLPYEQISYWRELSTIIAYCEGHVTAVLGICFGGLAVGMHLGIEKQVFDEKLYGVFPVQSTHAGSRYFDYVGQSYNLALSTWALLDSKQVAEALHTSIDSIVKDPVLGHLILESRDRKFCMVLGHPEYTIDTLYQEWKRDSMQKIAYTKNFGEGDFENMQHELAANSSSFIASWVTSHAAQLYVASPELVELDAQ